MRAPSFVFFVIAAGACTEATPAMYSVAWRPVEVAPGVEATECVWLRLGNPTEIKINLIHDTLSPTSHHVVVYQDDVDTTEQTTPMPCKPLAGALDRAGTVTPLVTTQRPDDLLALPEGVGLTLAANQMIKLEMHYINATDTTQLATATSELYVADPATIRDEASVLFVATPDIDLMAGQSTTLHEFFTLPPYVDLSAAYVFAMAGHEHRLGTGVEVGVGSAAAGPMTPVYVPGWFSWADPTMVTFATPFGVPQGGGFDITCTWTNTTNAEVKFGGSANDEMCGFFAYYYPAVPAKVCWHSDQLGLGGIDVCCPGDDTICRLIEQL